MTALLVHEIQGILEKRSLNEIFNNLKSTINQRSFLNFLNRPKKNSSDALIYDSLQLLERSIDSKQKVLLKEHLWVILEKLEFKYPGFSEFFVHWQKGEIALYEKDWEELSQQFETALFSLPGLLRHLIPFLKSRHQLGNNGKKFSELYEVAQTAFKVEKWVEAKKHYSFLLNLYHESFGYSVEHLKSQYAFCDRALKFNFLYERTREQIEVEYWEEAHGNLLTLIEWSCEGLYPERRDLELMLENCGKNMIQLTSENMSDKHDEMWEETKNEWIASQPSLSSEEVSRNLDIFPEVPAEESVTPLAKTPPKKTSMQQIDHASANKWVGICLLLLAAIGLSYILLTIEPEVPVYEVKQSQRLDPKELPAERPIDKEVDFVRTGSLEDKLVDK
ncbi:MAG: hypothetical protein AAF696_30395 [Bacteroidota bacterium]